MSSQPSEPAQPSELLVQQHCQPCEGGVPKLTAEQIQQLLPQVPQWQVDSAGDAITKDWKFRNFVSAIDFLNRVASIAEEQQHHPDLHLTGYRHMRIELTTHAIGGLSENDFILAAKIDQVAGL